MPVTRLLQIIAAVCGVIALTLGMGTYTHTNLSDIHMLFGLLVSLVLLIQAILATATSGLRRIGIISIVYALIVPIFGVTQQMILVGDLHWLVEAAHLFVGVGAITLVGTIAARFVLIKKHAEVEKIVSGDTVRQARPIR